MLGTLNRKRRVQLLVVFAVLSSAQSCTKKLCRTFAFFPYIYFFKACRCEIGRDVSILDARDNCSRGGDGGIRGPFCQLADGTTADKPECCSDLSLEDQLARLRSAQPVPACTSTPTCKFTRVDSSGFPPANCPQPPEQDQAAAEGRITATLEIAERSLSIAAELSGGGPRAPGKPDGKAATAGTSGQAAANQNSAPLVAPKASPGAKEAGGGSGRGGSGGGSSSFGAEGTAPSETTETTPLAMTDQAGLPSGGGGGKPKPTGATEDLAENSMDAPSGTQDSLLYAGGIPPTRFNDGGEAYWGLIPAEVSLFKVVTVRYTKTSQGWARARATEAAGRVR